MATQRNTDSTLDASTTSHTPGGLRPLMTQTYLAEVLVVSERKLERDRHEGTGIPFVKIGRRVLYRREDVLMYLEANRFTSTAEAKRTTLQTPNEDAADPIEGALRRPLLNSAFRAREGDLRSKNRSRKRCPSRTQ
jgi:excisionase family DNA binding protein